MTRTRVTVPEGHLALVLTKQLADELNSLAMRGRQAMLQRYRLYRSNEEPFQREKAIEAKLLADTWGDVLLAILEAQEG